MQNTSGLSVNLQPVCVVGIGASAGGLEALQQFLTFLPSNTGMAFVVIQHLSPDHKSLLADILGKYCAMPITEITDGMRVERNHVYMIPPRFNVEIISDVLMLRTYDPGKINHPIDYFFRSLAESYENRSVAVILSGTGSDGTNGIRSIKEHNGVIIVQSPESAKFDGMPRNAISTGFADLIQKPDSIAKEMAHIAHSMLNASERFMLTDNDLMSQVFSILKNVTNINYTYYKQTTVLRRVERRLVVTHSRNLQEYVSYLTNNPEEAKLLAKEVLIGVTSFFRDSEYYEVLKETVIKQLLQDAPKGKEIRVWVAGCSTGEEAYSIAILFEEAMEELSIRRDIKIFGTDLDSDSIMTAVRGVYGDNIIEDVSISRLSRFFTRKGNKYVIRHDIRKMIIFAQHNVFQDPPFGKLDLISCRNVLIYFQAVLQRNLFAIFHSALNDLGYLFLGRSESVIDYDDVFRIHSANEKIFIHNAHGRVPSHDSVSYSMQNLERLVEPIPQPQVDYEPDVQYKSGELDTSVLESLLPASVLINSKNEMTRSYGDCSDYLSIPVGEATFDIFMLLRNDLKIPVSTVLRDSRNSGTKVGYYDVPIQTEHGIDTISIVAQPIMDRHGQMTKHTAVSFLQPSARTQGDLQQYQVDTAAAQRIANLEHELRLTRENLRQTVTELESVNAELQAANEELLTANEELQSSNEELQSVNEELYTVNSEFQAKVSELAGLNDDMTNFLSTTLVGILMVDRDLNIRKFTEYISSEFNVVDQDVGRSLRYISYNFATIDLIHMCRQVLSTMDPIEQLCASVAGKTYLIRIAPYQADDSPKPADTQASRPARSLQGLVLTFVDTTKQVDDQEQIEEMARALRQAVKSGQEKETFLSHMSHDMRTPMTAIFGLTQLSLQDKHLPLPVRENLEKIQTSSNYLLGLVEEILETSRINAGKVVTVSTPEREDAVLDSVSAIIGEQARSANLHFSMRVHGCEDRYVMMDEKHVERILVNLLTNSVKFTPAGGNVSLDVDVSYHGSFSEHIYIVKDDGIGIREHFQKRLFLPFEQDNTDGEPHDGTGLGLYICKNLVDLLGGEISYRSRSGEGTEFTVKMRYTLASPEQIRMRMPRSVTYEDQILYGKNILLAEDNTLVAEVLIKILSTKGIHAQLARDGQEVINMFRTRGPYYYQAILMDLMMPIIDGGEATRAIRALNQADAATIPIIALTADVTENVYERCREAGMNDCVCKPVDRDKLFNCLAREFEAQIEQADPETPKSEKIKTEVGATETPETKAKETELEETKEGTEEKTEVKETETTEAAEQPDNRQEE